MEWKRLLLLRIYILHACKRCLVLSKDNVLLQSSLCSNGCGTDEKVDGLIVGALF